VISVRRRFAVLLVAQVMITVAGIASASAQVENVIQTRIGLVELQIPKDFVSNWAASRQVVQVEFSYPETEPLGRFRFGDDNREQWTDRKRALLKRGGQILYVTLQPIRDLKPLPDGSERERVASNMCRFKGGVFDTFSEFEIDFLRCKIGDEVTVQPGHHSESGLVFLWDIHMDVWRVVKRSLKERMLSSVDIRKESLKDWRAIVSRVDATIDSWKK
jgi:hypothetical protein